MLSATLKPQRGLLRLFFMEKTGKAQYKDMDFIRHGKEVLV